MKIITNDLINTISTLKVLLRCVEFAFFFFRINCAYNKSLTMTLKATAKYCVMLSSCSVCWFQYEIVVYFLYGRLEFNIISWLLAPISMMISCWCGRKEIPNNWTSDLWSYFTVQAKKYSYNTNTYRESNVFSLVLMFFSLQSSDCTCTCYM